MFDIDREWSKVQIKQRFEDVELVDPNQPKAPGTCRFVCVSDTHSRHHQMTMPEGDVLLHAGDFSSIGLAAEVEKFAEWVRDLPYQHKIIIAGNHDIPFDTDGYVNVSSPPMHTNNKHFLINSSTERATCIGVFTAAEFRNLTIQRKSNEV